MPRANFEGDTRAKFDAFDVRGGDAVIDYEKTAGFENTNGLGCVFGEIEFAGLVKVFGVGVVVRRVKNDEHEGFGVEG